MVFIHKCCYNHDDEGKNDDRDGGIDVVMTNAKRSSNSNGASATATTTSNSNSSNPKRHNVAHLFIIYMISQYVLIIGFIIQQYYSPKCGLPEAYEICFKECPFSNYKFNHNFYYHILHGISVFIVIIGTYWKILIQ